MAYLTYKEFLREMQTDVVYHGSKNTHLVFSEPKEGSKRPTNMQLDFGTHFTTDEYASFYSGDKGRKYAAVITLNNPLNLTDNTTYAWKGEPLFDQLLKLKIALGIKPRGDDYYDKYGVKHTDIQNVGIVAHDLNALPPYKASTILKEFGYDGVIYEPYHPSANITSGVRYYEKPKSYIVFNKDAIKLV